MFKFKNFKILLLLMLFAFAGNDAWAGGGKYWYYSCIELRCTPSGAGKVYASTDQTKAQNPNNCVITTDGLDGNAYQTSGRTYRGNRPYKWFVNTVPSNSQQYRFIKWVDQNGNDVSTDQAPQNSFNDYDCAVGLDPNEKKSDASGDPIDDYPTIVYTAVYERIVNQYVAVESQDAGHLTATIDKPENQIGEEVTLWAYPNNYDTKFTGWYKDGELVSMENPWTFIIDQDNAGTYSATCKTDYKFFRIKNKGTLRKFNAINDQGSIDDFSALQLVSGDVATYSPGSVVEISTYHVSGGEVYDYKMQNAQTSSHYTVSEGKYMTMALNSEDNTWIIHPNRQAAYMADEGGSNVTAYGAIENDIAHWYIEPMDKDLETKENYFSLDPNKLVEVDGKYYTTLRTSWNILFNPEQMTPYIVKSVNETEGTFEMEPIAGNIIPAGTPVIIETKSNDVEENRMVPTLTNAASGAVPSGNLLQHSEKYFPNQPAPVSNCKGLYKNANGQLAFGGNALTTVNGNEAYLSVANEVVHDVQPVLTETTLANLLEYGEIGPNYKITDLTCVYIQGNTLYCKDDNHALNKSVIYEGEEDYIKTYTALQNGDWDQSNWIAINLPEGSSVTTDYMEAVIDHRLNNVVGRLKSKINPEFEATLMPSGGDENPYDENTYITCNFSGVHQQGVVNGKEVELFFVAPKPMEIAQVEWAMWDAESEMFIMPHAADDSRLHGAFLPNFSMLENVSNPNPQDGYGYHFPALIKLTETSSQSSAPILAAGNSSTWTVYPLEWNTDTPTAIDNLQAGKTVTRVVYYNLMGVESDVPHPGINIVEKRYSDGSRSVEKIMK